MSSVFDSREWILYKGNLSSLESLWEDKESLKSLGKNLLSLESLWEDKESLNREPIFPCAEKASGRATTMTGHGKT